MSDDTKPAASTFLAGHLARKGSDELDKLQTTLDLARQLLASGKVEPYTRAKTPSNCLRILGRSPKSKGTLQGVFSLER